MSRAYYGEYNSIDNMIKKALKFTKYRSLVREIGRVWKALSKTLPKGEYVYCISSDPGPIMQRQWEIEDSLKNDKEDIFVLNIPWQEFSPGQETFLVTAIEGVVVDDTTGCAIEKKVTCYLYSIVIPRFKGGKIVNLDF
jgi:hypothetical protein